MLACFPVTIGGQLENGLGNPITALGIGIDSGLTYPLTIKEDTNNSYIHFVNSTTGSAFSDGSQIGVPSGSSDFLINNRESANIRILTSGDEKMRIEADGDIAFYDDANNQGLFWDASTARLGLGTTSPNGRLNIKSSASGQYLLNLDYADNTDGGGFYESSSTDLTLFLKDSSGNTDVQIASNGNSYFNGGNVGIG